MTDMVGRRHIRSRLRSHRVWSLAVLALLVAVAIFAVSCGEEEPAVGGGGGAGSPSPGGGGVEEARQLVEDYMQPHDDWTPPGEPFDASGAKGKKVFYLSYFLTIPFEQNNGEGIKEGVEAAGATFTAFDGKGQVSEFSRGIQQAIAQDYDVIVESGIIPESIAPDLQAAKDAGIPVVVTHTQDTGPLLPDTPDSIVASATHSYSLPGKMEAAFIAADSGGQGKVMFIESQDLRVINDALRDAFTEELNRLAPEMEIEYTNVNASQWQTLSTLTANLIRQNPDVEYLVPLFDGMVLFMVPSVHAAGAQNDVKIVSFNATPAVMEFMANEDVVIAESGSPQVWQGWAIADQVLRVLTDNEPIDDVDVPERLFTKDNIPDMSTPESSWYGSADFRSLYKELWGLE